MLRYFVGYAGNRIMRTKNCFTGLRVCITFIGVFIEFLKSLVTLTQQVTMEELLKTVETLKSQVEALSKKLEEQKQVVKRVDKRALTDAKKKVQEEFVRELLKNEYEITNDENDKISCAELSRYLAVKTDKYSPRVLDNIIGRMLKTTTCRDKNTNSKMKIGIKRVECEIQD